MRLTVIQPALEWEDKPANLANFEKKLAPLAGQTDLVVLPEMFTTGFTMNPAPFAERDLGQTATWMREQAKKLDAAIVGSFISSDRRNYFNRLIFAKPDGTAEFYDKKHLFTPAGEAKIFTAGKKRLILEWRGWRVCPLICYDLRFPVFSRNKTGEKGYDLLLYVANWPAPRIEHWKTLLAARAIENVCFVAGANVVGTDGNGNGYTGDSAIIDFMGKKLWTATGEEAIGTAVLDKMALVHWREKFPALAEADGFKLN